MDALSGDIALADCRPERTSKLKGPDSPDLNRSLEERTLSRCDKETFHHIMRILTSVYSSSHMILLAGNISSS